MGSFMYFSPKKTVFWMMSSPRPADPKVGILISRSESGTVLIMMFRSMLGVWPRVQEREAARDSLHFGLQLYSIFGRHPTCFACLFLLGTHQYFQAKQWRG